MQYSNVLEIDTADIFVLYLQSNSSLTSIYMKQLTRNIKYCKRYDTGYFT